MNVSQCDNCRGLGAATPSGWIIASVVGQRRPSYLSSLLGDTGGVHDVAGMFCTWRCMAEYAAARALIPGAEAAS